MKKLITANEIEQAHKNNEKFIYIDNNTIITPSARDIANLYQIEFCNEKENHDNGIDSELIFNALKIMLGKGEISSLLKFIGDEKLPFLSKKDESGLEIIDGKTVHTNEIGEGVRFLEIINEDKSSGFLEIDGSYEKMVNSDETGYLIEGSLKIDINKNSYTADKGDVIYMPKGSKIKLTSLKKAKIFFTSYPSKSNI